MRRVIRPFLLGRTSNFRSVSSTDRLYETQIASPNQILSPNSSNPCNLFYNTGTPKFHFSTYSLQLQRTFNSSAGPSNIVLIESEEQLNTALKNVQDKYLPAIFYFTAAWCGPCKFISPILSELSGSYPEVTTYKIDIDQVQKQGLGSALSKLFITAVPTLHFFLNGKKTAEIVGADVARLKDTMEELYGALVEECASQALAQELFKYMKGPRN